MMTKLVEIIVQNIKQSPWFILLSLFIVLLSSLITISSAIVVIKNTYAKTSYGEKRLLLDKIEQLTPEAHIEYFKEVLGSPVFINVRDTGKEFIFFNKYSFIEAVTDESEKVIAFSVTTRRKNFNPSILIGPFGENGEALKIKLGISTFSELDESNLGEPKVVSSVGAHTFFYDEEYYLANPGNYQTYIFSVNQSGYLRKDQFAPYSEHPISITNLDVVKYRQSAVINTYTITSPFITSENINKASFGPNYDQIRIIPHFYTD